VHFFALHNAHFPSFPSADRALFRILREILISFPADVDFMSVGDNHDGYITYLGVAMKDLCSLMFACGAGIPGWGAQKPRGTAVYNGEFRC
jgi:hypothetical protein